MSKKKKNQKEKVPRTWVPLTWGVWPYPRIVKAPMSTHLFAKPKNEKSSKLTTIQFFEAKNRLFLVNIRSKKPCQM